MTVTVAIPAVSTRAMTVLSALLEARTGQQLASYRSWRLDMALKPLLREREIDTLDQLVALLLDGRDATIGDRIVEALVNGESSFFRDQPVFGLIGKALVARAEASGQHGQRLRIWCAGCATGQEPLSLAMLFADLAESSGIAMPEIVATDVSEGALARARSGRYTQFEIQRGLPIRTAMRWFNGDRGDWVAKPELVRMIQFRRQNLVSEAPPPGRFDAVLCRNVLLYLAPAIKARVFLSVADALAPGGVLVLGAGETVIGQTGLFEPSRAYRGLYQRVAAGMTRNAA
ncbi:protein-glutamate O-methyltransferase CheR [Sphingomonas sp. KR1UV-12]|uniref:Protein-glutamate O-methyltransferase CheR n=1 Tax=Sphingomonas aurea TaxID=3063994 RepID=A0ABT9EGW6_9SPHN|nr:protein-glutamate O-methyltransferase CheR [Sphingomonas sp. KR1UV-12]MDP1026023.1 protein-glutamate O-methyltransferase CheR [Sphingomonas sp. KR1UV-12]